MGFRFICFWLFSTLFGPNKKEQAVIGQLRGIIIDKQPPALLLDVQGVGYELSLPMSSFYKLPAVGSEVVLHTQMLIRDDGHYLYGFASKGERLLFREMLKASGVGPKLALTILSGLSVEQFLRSVDSGDVATLIKLPGVGRKTAERLLLELRDRLAQWQQPPALTSGEAGTITLEDTFIRPPSAEEDAIAALVALGYKEAQASQSVKKIAKAGLSSEELIRLALKAML